MKKTSRTTKTSGKLSVVFFGSGPVASKSLRLLAQDFEIEAIVTKPTTVKEMSASVKGTCVYSVNNKNELDDLILARPFESKLGVLIDFGIIVSQTVIDYFPLGIVNSHFSLLPQWRGADPITFAILSGQTKTGVSLMLIDAGMDTGKLIGQKTLPLSGTETTPVLTDKLIQLSYEMLLGYLPRYVSGEVKPRRQPHPDRTTYSRKLTKEDGIIDWNKPAEQIEREIRAFVDWPKSRTMLAGKDVVITKAHVAKRQSTPGDVIVENKKIVVGCGKDALIIDKLKPAGKNEMAAEAFLAGHRI